MDVAITQEVQASESRCYHLGEAVDEVAFAVKEERDGCFGTDVGGGEISLGSGGDYDVEGIAYATRPEDELPGERVGESKPNTAWPDDLIGHDDDRCVRVGLPERLLVLAVRPLAHRSPLGH